MLLGHTPPNVVQQAAELLMDWWSQIGIDVTDKAIPQNDFINNAALGTPDFQAFLWRSSTAAIGSTSRRCGGTAGPPSPTGRCR